MNSYTQMTVTWTSGYGINEAEPFVEWGRKDGDHMRSPAGTLTFNRNSMCGGWLFYLVILHDSLELAESDIRMKAHCLSWYSNFEFQRSVHQLELAYQKCYMVSFFIRKTEKN